jgi:hypothetical protein
MLIMNCFFGNGTALCNKKKKWIEQQTAKEKGGREERRKGRGEKGEGGEGGERGGE